MTQEVSIMENGGKEVAAPNSAESIMSVIGRAAADPNTDVDKLERLLAMFERLKAAEAKAAYISALVIMKPKLPVIDRRGCIVIHDKADKQKVIQSTPYALYEDIDEAITPILTEHGFVINFRSGVALDGKITVTGILSHRGGHSDETTVTLPHDSSGSKNAVQAVGSSTTYGKRMTATLLLNIRTAGFDDDGQAGGAESEIETLEVDELQDLIDRSHSPADKFLKYMGVEKLHQIKRRDIGKAREALNTALSVYQRKQKAAVA